MHSILGNRYLGRQCYCFRKESPCELESKLLVSPFITHSPRVVPYIKPLYSPVQGGVEKGRGFVIWEESYSTAIAESELRGRNQQTVQ